MRHQPLRGRAVELDWRQAAARRRRPQRLVDHSSADHSSHVAIALLIAVAIALAAVTSWLFPGQPTLPMVSLAALGMTAATVVAAWSCRAGRNHKGLTLWDTAGAFALIGFGAGILSDPQSIVNFFVGDRPPE